MILTRKESSLTFNVSIVKSMDNISNNTDSRKMKMKNVHARFPEIISVKMIYNNIDENQNNTWFIDTILVIIRAGSKMCSLK